MLPQSTGMSDEFHARVKAVFTEAIGAPSSERIAFRVCRGDAALREQVDVVLDNHVPGSIIGQKLGSDPVPRPPRARRKTASTIGAELSRVLSHRARAAFSRARHRESHKMSGSS